MEKPCEDMQQQQHQATNMSKNELTTTTLVNDTQDAGPGIPQGTTWLYRMKWVDQKKCLWNVQTTCSNILLEHHGKPALYKMAGPWWYPLKKYIAIISLKWRAQHPTNILGGHSGTVVFYKRRGPSYQSFEKTKGQKGSVTIWKGKSPGNLEEVGGAPISTSSPNIDTSTYMNLIFSQKMPDKKPLI